MTNKKVFKSINGLELVVLYKKSAVIFEIGNNEIDNRFDFRFNSKTFKELFYYLKDFANKAWDNIQLRECDSLGSDYVGYYDKELDNDGYLQLDLNELFIERVCIGNNRLYKFNKRKMESFLYDFDKLIKKSY
ncbi:hypothetical protein ACFHWD_03605 [Clostridium sp. MT-14]|uniref:hypothetical protein n=1 Tax=Clostridium sp. MT-14 TaxID=3348360 RepID=UPI0035F2C472